MTWSCDVGVVDSSARATASSLMLRCVVACDTIELAASGSLVNITRMGIVVELCLTSADTSTGISNVYLVSHNITSFLEHGAAKRPPNTTNKQTKTKKLVVGAGSHGALITIILDSLDCGQLAFLRSSAAYNVLKRAAK